MAASPPKAADHDPATQPDRVGRRPENRTFRTPLRRLLADRAARWAVVGGGFAIIASILGILLFIVIEVSPVFSNAELTKRSELSVPGGPFLASVVDEYRESALVLDEGGRLREIGLPEGDFGENWDVLEPTTTAHLTAAKVDARGRAIAALSSDGRAVLLNYDFSVAFDGSTRRITPELDDPDFIDLDAQGDLGPLDLRNLSDEGELLLVINDQAADSLLMVRRVSEENLFTGEVTRDLEREIVPAPPDLAALAIHSDLARVFGATKSGRLVLWERVDGAFQAPRTYGAEGSAITSMTFLFGDGALAVGRQGGDLEIWFPLRDDESGGLRLELVRRFEAHDAPIREIVPSP